MKKNKEKMLEFKGLIDIENFAASLASADAEDQALFLNIFFKALKINCEDTYRYQMQLAYISENIVGKEPLEAFIFLANGD